MAILNIFANFFIDSEERFLRMQDSFRSFKDISADKWVINARGRYAEQTLAFLRSQIGDKLVSYKLHSKEGWFHDTRQMLPDIDGDYVLFWVEDHINLAKIDLLDKIVLEMKLNCLDVMGYSQWFWGIRRQRYKDVELTAGEYLDYFEQNESNNRLIQASANGQSWLICCATIIKRQLFSRIILADDPIPRRWPKNTPFDFEKAPFDVHWLPLKMAFSRQELFVTIDDDAGFPGYCLQSRGLYPVREGRMSYALPLGKGAHKFIAYLKTKYGLRIPKRIEMAIRELIELIGNLFRS